MGSTGQISTGGTDGGLIWVGAWGLENFREVVDVFPGLVVAGEGGDVVTWEVPDSEFDF